MIEVGKGIAKVQNKTVFFNFDDVKYVLIYRYVQILEVSMKSISSGQK